MKIRLPFFICFFVSTSLFAQDDVLENTPPPSIKWSQINTPNFRVIFPQGFDEQGERMANTLEYIKNAEAKSMGKAPRKISIILQNQTSVSNGFVSILPRRSEFYAMPAQDYNFLGTNDWLNLLAAHEYRHIVQYQHAKRGFNKLFYYLFGATTLAGMAQAAAPSWFWEGDAVATETAFTRSGRGKIPNFGLVFKTNLLEGRSFNYHKQYLRSYKHNIPNHYVLGYYMVSYLRKRTNDADVWEKITARSWSVPFIPFAFSNAIKRETGFYVTGLYKEMVKDLKQEWQNEIDNLKLSTYQKLPVARKRAYTDYQYPQPLADGGVLTVKRGIGDITQFVILDSTTKHVFTPGYINDSGMISAHGSTVVWNEYGFDPRWNVRTYSLIKAYNLKTKKKFVVGSKKARYSSAAISADESKIVAVETDTDYKTKLVLLSFPDGKILKEFSNPQNHFYSMPRFSEDGDEIVSLKTTSQGRTIAILNTINGEEKEVIPYAQENVGYPVLYKNYVLYNSPVTGIDNIFALDLNTNKRYQITTSKYAAYNPAVSADGKTLYYNEQTRDGLDVVHIPFEPSIWQIFNGAQPNKNSLSQNLVEQEGRPHLFDSIPQQQIPVKRFSKLNGLINPYTWGFFLDSKLTSANIGITSQDILSTTRIEAGYNFDINERTSAWRTAISYQGLFPIIDFSASVSNRSISKGSRQFYDTLTIPFTTVDKEVRFKWREKNIQTGLRIPLVTTSSKFAGNISVANYLGLTQVTDFKNSITNGGRIIPVTDSSSYFFRDFIDRGNLLYNNLALSASRLMKRSRRDINSKWGQSLSVDYYATPFGSDFKGNLFALTGLVYLPGLAKHHSLWGYWAYQTTQIKNERDNYIFRNQIPLPRGQTVDRFQKFYSMSANYTLPLWYPDIALGPLVNIQRLRANTFIDYGYGVSPISSRSQTYISTGIEAKIDLNILRFLPQLDVGVRFTRGIDPALNKFEILIGTLNL